MTTTSARIWQRANDAHAALVERGEHDEQCEWRPAGFYICHCSKRKREREGYTEPPGELEYVPPLCPRCGEHVHHDGDDYHCPPCKVSWSDNYTAHFVDDHGDLAAELAKWEAAHGRA